MSKQNRPTNEEARQALLTRAAEMMLEAASMIASATDDTEMEDQGGMIEVTLTTASEWATRLLETAERGDWGNEDLKWGNDEWSNFAFRTCDPMDMMSDDKISEVQGQFYDEAEDSE